MSSCRVWLWLFLNPRISDINAVYACRFPSPFDKLMFVDTKLKRRQKIKSFSSVLFPSVILFYFHLDPFRELHFPLHWSLPYYNVQGYFDVLHFVHFHVTDRFLYQMNKNRNVNVSDWLSVLVDKKRIENRLDLICCPCCSRSSRLSCIVALCKHRSKATATLAL